MRKDIFAIFFEKVRSKYFISILLKVVYTVLTPITIILLARILGPEEFGIYAFSLSVLTLLSVPTNLGFPAVILRYTAKYYYKQNWGELKGLLRFTNLSVITIGALIISLFFGFLSIVDHTIDDSIKNTIILGLPLVLVLGLEGLRSSTLIGMNKVIVGQLPTKVIRPFLFIIIILSTVFLFDNIKATHAIIIYLSAAIFSYGYGALILLRNIPGMIRKVVTKYEYRLWISSAVPLLILGSVQVLGAQIDLILLGIFRSNEEVGIYKVVYQTGLLVIFGLSAINSVIAPKISKYFIDHNISDLKLLMRKCNWSIFLLGLPAGLIFILIGDIVLGFVFGIEYVGGYLALVIIVIGRLINALLGSSALMLKMTGFEKVAAHGIVLGTLVNIVLGLVLIPKFGIEGAAIGSSAGLITWNLFLLKQINKKFKMSPL